MADYKKSPQTVWDSYVKPGAADQIDLSEGGDSSLLQDWMAAGADQQLLATQGKSLCDRLRVHVKRELNGAVLPNFIVNGDVKQQLGIIDIAPLKKEVLDTAEKYNGQIERAVAKWKKLQPQFWTPLDESLQAIIRYVNAN